MRIWDRNTGKVVTTLAGHTKPVLAVAIAPDGLWLATGGWDRTVRIWNATTGHPVTMMRFEEPVYACTWAPDGHSLAVGSVGGLYLYEFRSESDVRCTRVPAPPTSRSPSPK
ncbi:WD40 repeat domain-containing protein [Streptomyces xanthophaeus]|uniref:WD40 repeat domain-containing protein n=1 Tax=Streptomyces xanthophaeus TaxID=67385 RepID=UPI003870983C